jgi:hypothetical protein
LPWHVDVRQRFLRELVNLKAMRLLPCSTHKMVADALTKSLPESAYFLIVGFIACIAQRWGSRICLALWRFPPPCDARHLRGLRVCVLL